MGTGDGIFTVGTGGGRVGNAVGVCDPIGVLASDACISEGREGGEVNPGAGWP